ncbi:MAG TPA: hypothetical protein VL346_00630 [Acidobacteriaceae bacterium]|nr:hypothetical protein [Acidobacteriaceae bacterium]
MPDNNRSDLRRIQVKRIQALYEHFFRRFFDNDTLSTEGETETTVVRALCTVAVPPLMAAFWLYPHYAQYPPRNIWAVASDRYFFVLYSFIVMGLVATVEWEMLFPDRADFQILLPLGLREWEMFWAKGKALLKFLGMFLIAANLFPTFFYAAASTPPRGPIWRNIGIHAVASLASGTFAAFALLAIGGIAVCLIPPRWFRRVSTVVQTLTVTALVGMFLPFPFFGSHMQMLLSSSTGISRWLPPVWFLGLYERMIRGAAATPAAGALTATALWALAISVAAAIAIYPLAWARQRRRAMEGDGRAQPQRSRSLLRPVLHRLLRMPQQRAVFHFITQTITRSQRYQLYLAFYGGTGLALAACCAFILRERGGILGIGISNAGIRAVLPLLLFWIAMGLRTAFAFPVDMRARWIFPMSLKADRDTEQTHTARAGQLWLFFALLGVVVLFPFALTAAGLWWWPVLLETACSLLVVVLLAAALFVGRTQIPFTRPRLPGRKALPVVMVTYAAIFPALVLSTVQLELAAERRAAILGWAIAGAAAALLILRALDLLACKGIIGAFPEDEEEEGPLRLGLTR